MKKVKKNAITLMCITALLTGFFPVRTFATEINTTGKKGIVPVNLTVEITTFSVTVPTFLPVIVSSTGKVTVSSKNSIINKSFGPVEIKSIRLIPDNDWILKDYNTDFTKVKVNAKEFGFQLNGNNVDRNGNIDINEFNSIDGNGSFNFTYDAKIAPQVKELNQCIANLVFTLGWFSESTQSSSCEVNELTDVEQMKNRSLKENGFLY